MAGWRKNVYMCINIYIWHRGIGQTETMCRDLNMINGPMDRGGYAHYIIHANSNQIPNAKIVMVVLVRPVRCELLIE